MTGQQLAQLAAINAAMNVQPYVLDSPLELPDTWKCQPDGKGWLCRDYVECKAEKLHESGWSGPPPLTILCYDELGEYHAVLGIVDGTDTWILDNRAEGIYRLAAPPYAYRWDRIQVAGTDQFEAMT